MHGRLSIYYSSPVGEEYGDCSGHGSDSDNDDDDETVTESMGDLIYDLDSDNEDDDEMQAVDADHNYKKAMLLQSDGAVTTTRLRLGPPQDADVTGGKKIPPQLQVCAIRPLFSDFGYLPGPFNNSSKRWRLFFVRAR